MKKSILCVIFTVIISLFAVGDFLSAETQSAGTASPEGSSLETEKQGAITIVEPVEVTLLPKEVYIGDTAEYRCVIQPAIDLLPADTDKVSLTVTDDIRSLLKKSSAAYSIFSENTEKVAVVKSLELQKTENGYVLRIYFTPWVPGELSLGTVDVSVFPEIATYLKIGENTGEQATVLVTLPPVHISYLSEKLGEWELKPSAAPILFPGSIYVIYGMIILCIVFLILAIILLTHLKQIKTFASQLSVNVRLAKNYKSAKKMLKKLKKVELSEGEFAATLEGIIRRYLEGRFKHPFTAAAASEVELLFDTIFVGLLSPEQSDIVEGIAGILYRCDYVRYAPDSHLETGENLSLIGRTEDYIDFMEKEGR